MLNVIDNFQMKNVTTLGIGGPAEKFVSVTSESDLIEAIKYASENNLAYLVIGGGSNLLVSDAGVDKLIIKNDIKGIDVIPAKAGIHKNHAWIPDQLPKGGCVVRDDKVTLSVKSGVSLQDLVNFSIQHGLSGLQKMTGIPGTVGGAVYGNAGAYGQTISDHITSVVILGRTQSEAWRTTPESEDSGQARVTLTKDQCEFNYRDSTFKKNEFTILEVTFQLETGDTETLQKEADEILSKRLVKYPKGIKCPGSFFKNIVAETLTKAVLEKVADKVIYGKLPAGALLEEVGAKGDSQDGIEIADYHANLFINSSNGTAKAFYDLAQKYVKLVKDKFGITLEPEVQLINLPPL
ncbi:MAG: FAD-binding protein [Candidatus Daviesbacteria bacterium]|nr:FAD-binding protein [Candidatus Daviesbacteria bacterium]